MPIPPLKKRSYGYSEQPHSEEPRPNYEKPRSKTKKVLLFLWRALTKVIKILGRAVKWLFLKLFKNAKRDKKGFLKKIFLFGVIAFAVFFLFAVGTIFVLSRDLPDPDKLSDRNIAQSTKIYDRTGKHLLYEVYADEKRTLVELDQIPKNLINGVIATEDKKFYEHRGIRPLSLARAVFYGVFTSKRIGGTSTLTQQLIKNAILTNERKITRKLKEFILAIRLEQKYTKNQILKIYFNEIPYGSTNYGAQAAAQSYFGKDVSELNLQECATLAGLPQAPSTYLNNPEALLTRRNFVLKRMFQEGYITREEADAAQSEPLTLEKRYSDIFAPHFVLYVKELLVRQFGEQTVDTGGFKVITSLDWEKQQAAEKIISEEFKEGLLEAGADNASLLAMKPETGEILAMVGSRDFFDEEIDGQFNVATLGKRQPGSSFKPIIYAAAFEKGYTPETVLYDVLTNFSLSANSYTPENYDLKERGPVTMRQALQGSLNIPAVKTLYLVGLKQGIEFAERLGYSTMQERDFGLSLVLGGGEVKLMDHVRAYAVFANRGFFVEPASILKVEDSRGNTVFEFKNKNKNRVIDQTVADTLSSVLSDDASRAYMFGAGGTLTLKDRPVAAKTGTTNNYVDAWTIGYTPEIVAGVWAGNTDNRPMNKGYGGGRVAGQIWNKFMVESLKETPAANFTPPPPSTAEKPVLRGSEGGQITIKIDKMTGKIATEFTPEEFVEEKTYLQPHCILHYVDKDNPRGPVPEDPGQDPQYSVWENAIQDWVKRKKEKEPEWNPVFEDPPTEMDDVHSLDLVPELEIVSPKEGEVVFSRDIIATVKTSATRGVSRVNYQIDGKYVAVVSAPPFALNYFARDLEPGEHKITAVAEDDVGNRMIKEVNIILSAEENPPAVFWKNNSLRFLSDEFPITLFFEVRKPEMISAISFYAQKENGERFLISKTETFSPSENGSVSLLWQTEPEKGNWTIVPEVQLKTQQIFSGEKFNLQVVD